MKRVYAIMGTVLLTVFSYYLVTACTDRIVRDSAVESHQHTAAIAIRDPAPGYQQWGTEHFTRPYLNRYYSQSWYFNQTDDYDVRGAFMNTLQRALQQYQAVDLYLLAHTNNYYTWIKELKPALRKKIRLVYNSGCDNLDQGKTWLKLGAKTYIGHPGRSASPLFYFYFLRRWTRGDALQHAVEAGNDGMDKLLQIGAFFSNGRLNAGHVYDESKATIYGNRHIRF
jgi:hypothetical protein